MTIAPPGTNCLWRSRRRCLSTRDRYDMRQQHAIATPMLSQVLWQLLGAALVRCAHIPLSRANHLHTHGQRALTRQNLVDARCKGAEQPEHQHDQNHAFCRPVLEWVAQPVRRRSNPRATCMAGSETTAVGKEVQHRTETRCDSFTQRRVVTNFHDPWWQSQEILKVVGWRISAV